MQILEVLSEIQRITCHKARIGKTTLVLTLHLELIYSNFLTATIRHGKDLNLLLKVNVKDQILALIITQIVYSSKLESEITETRGIIQSKVKTEKIILQEKSLE